MDIWITQLWSNPIRWRTLEMVVTCERRITGESSFQWSTVLSDCCKEYLTVTKFMTSLLLQMKYWTLWYMDHFSASSYTRVTYCQKWSEFSWLKLISIFGTVWFLQIYAKNIKYGDILNITFTPDKELDILIYRSPSHLIIYRSHTLLKWSGFFWPTLYISKNKEKNRIFSIFSNPEST